MKWILTILFLLIIAIFVGLLLIEFPGTAQIIWLGYEVKTTAVLFILILAFVFFIIVLLGRVIRWLIRVPQKWGSSYQHSQDEKMNTLLLKLLLAFEAEEIKTALEYQKKAKQNLAQNPFFLWISGQVFENAKNHLEAEKCFFELTKNPLTLFLGLKGQIRAAMHRRDFNQAYDFLTRAEQEAPSSPWVLKHLLALARHSDQFEQEEVIILKLEDLGVITQEQSQMQIAKSQYRKAMSLNTPLMVKEACLRQAHYLDAALSEATEELALLLKSQRQETYAATIIEETWAVNPNQKLGEVYFKIFDSTDPKNAFNVAQNLFEHNPKHPESLFFLARAALDANLWKAARSLLETLLKMNPTADVYQFLARLELEEKKDEKAALRWLEEGLKAPRHV